MAIDYSVGRCFYCIGAREYGLWIQFRVVPVGVPVARVAAVVLAAGRSLRTGSANKLLAPVGDKSMIECTVDAVLQSQPCTTIVVTGHDAHAVRTRLAGRALRFVHNPDFADGLSTSVRAGIASLGDEIEAALICLGDMPRITSQLLRRIVAAYDPVTGCAIVVPRYAGKRGNPVLWDRRFFAEILTLTGDVGARRLLTKHADLVCELASDDAAVLVDYDTPQELDELRD